jgi:hypothetical protein
MIENTHQRPDLIYRRVEGGIFPRRNPGEHSLGLSPLATHHYLYIFSVKVTEARVISQSMRNVQPPLAWS